MKDTKKRENKSKKDVLKSKIPIIVIGSFLAFFLLTVVGLAIFTHQLLYKSDYFIIKENRIDWLNEPLAREPYREFLKTGVGQNIFEFNISSASKEMLNSHPELKDMWIVRDFPNRLTIKVKPRVPIAQVGETSFFLTDEEGVVLTEVRDSIMEGLPIVAGVGWRLFRKVGQKEDSLRMKKALTLLKVINESDFINDHILTKIDVSDYRNISFIIEDGIEIKIGHSNFKERLNTLDNTLASMAMEKDEIRYIDLRFDDVVLGTK